MFIMRGPRATAVPADIASKPADLGHAEHACVDTRVVRTPDPPAARSRRNLVLPYLHGSRVGIDMSMSSSIATFVAGVVVSAAACGAAGTQSAQPSLSSDDQVLEAVFLHEIAAANVKPDEGLCLRVRVTPSSAGDASAGLVAAIARKHPKAIAGSACSGGGRDPVVVSATNAHGVMFDIGPVVRTTGAITVEGGGGHRGGGSIREVEYKLAAQGGGYRVVAERVLREN